MKSFDELYEEAEKRESDVSLLLGNGFSIAADNSFNYRRLLDRADFGSSVRDRRIRKVFETLDTADFELVVRRLEAAAEILDLYDDRSAGLPKIRRDGHAVRKALAETLAAVHPSRLGDIGDDRMDSCHDFLASFDNIFTLNYDLLLYWAINRKERAHFNDGFRRPERRLIYADPGAQNVSWLHGAAHLHEEAVAGDWPITVKQEWSGRVPLVDRLRDDIEAGQTPLIVMEGTWQQKQRKINSSLYLSDCLALFRDLSGTLFTYGWSISPNDLHIRTAIQNSRISHVNVGLYGSQADGTNPDTIGQANALSASSEGRISLEFWETNSADVW